MITGDEFMTTMEVAEYLNVSRSCVDRLIKNNEIPGYRISRSWRCRKSELQTWLEEQLVTANTVASSGPQMDREVVIDVNDENNP